MYEERSGSVIIFPLRLAAQSHIINMANHLRLNGGITTLICRRSMALFGGAFYNFYYSNQLEKLEAPPNRPAFPSS